MSSKKDNFYSKDKYFMNLAINLAKNRNNLTGLNPSVGCVIVKNDNIISYGQTGFNGSPHAEYEAIMKCKKKDLKNSTIYITMEPCTHYGKTPPCSNLIAKSKITRSLEELGQSEISTNMVGTMVMDGLKQMDPVAYIRFASVYRNFREEKDFVQFVDKINVFKKR